jgi:hypothetical protein
MRKILFVITCFFYFSSFANGQDTGVYLKNIKADPEVVKLTDRKYDTRVYIKNKNKIFDVLREHFGTYNIETSPKELEQQKNGIIYLGISKYGIAKTAEKKWMHDNAYCIFLERATGRLLYQSEIESCLGEWIDNLHWKKETGEVVDFSN